VLNGPYNGRGLAGLDAVAIALDHRLLNDPQHLLSRRLVQLREHGGEGLLKFVNVSHCMN
jgi:hypothetical protein